MDASIKRGKIAIKKFCSWVHVTISRVAKFELVPRQRSNQVTVRPPKALISFSDRFVCNNFSLFYHFSTFSWLHSFFFSFSTNSHSLSFILLFLLLIHFSSFLPWLFSFIFLLLCCVSFHWLSFFVVCLLIHIPSFLLCVFSFILLLLFFVCLLIRFPFSGIFCIRFTSLTSLSSYSLSFTFISFHPLAFFAVFSCNFLFFSLSLSLLFSFNFISFLGCFLIHFPSFLVFVSSHSFLFFPILPAHIHLSLWIFSQFIYVFYLLSPSVFLSSSTSFTLRLFWVAINLRRLPFLVFVIVVVVALIVDLLSMNGSLYHRQLCKKRWYLTERLLNRSSLIQNWNW